MLFDFFTKRRKGSNIQEEYVESVISILQSPLWDKTDNQIYLSLPKDLTQDTIEFAKKKLKKNKI